MTQTLQKRTLTDFYMINDKIHDNDEKEDKKDNKKLPSLTEDSSSLCYLFSKKSLAQKL